MYCGPFNELNILGTYLGKQIRLGILGAFAKMDGGEWGKLGLNQNNSFGIYFLPLNFLNRRRERILADYKIYLNQFALTFLMWQKIIADKLHRQTHPIRQDDIVKDQDIFPLLDPDSARELATTQLYSHSLLLLHRNMSDLFTDLLGLFYSSSECHVY